MNKLAKATSPYLRQHASNPVDWEEWGEAAFRRAREEDKPILLSVGYAACHWCHVMAHESFENEAIAKQMNAGFVAIKVDREERPDVDQLYQSAIQLLGVGGGWPLTVFLDADGKPFYGGTYYPPDDRYGRPGFPKLLAAIRDAWEKRRGEVQSNADELLAGIKELDVIPPPTEGSGTADVLATAGGWLARRVDADHGGFGQAPKFPNSMALEVLLRWGARDQFETARDAAMFSLGKMAEGGVYDHVGGGFHRYSVDERWHVPHFEKMLYDNALLVRSYVQGFQAGGLPWCRHIAEDIVTYLLREMRNDAGAFYASTDADSAPPSDPAAHAEEGEFFCWTKKELVALLGEEDAEIFSLRFGVTEEGNWEHGKNVLFLAMSDDDLAARTGRPVAEIRASLLASRAKAYAARESRPRPFRDEKILTSWNGLAIGAIAHAGAALGRTDFVEAAAKAAHAILAGAFVDIDGKKRLLRTPLEAGHPPLLGTSDDYANLADALLDLWEATLDPAWLDPAEAIATQARALFAGDDGAVYVAGQDGELLVHRPLALHDQSTPASSAILARVWLRLGRISGRDDLEKAALRVLAKHRHLMVNRPFGFSAMICAWDLSERPVDVVLAGSSTSGGSGALLAALRAEFTPNLALHVAGDGVNARSPLAKDKPPLDGKPTLYVCRDRTCSPPVTDATSLQPLLR